MPRPTYGQPHGVRLNPKQDERCRSAIRTTELLQRLNGFALEYPDNRTGKPIQMSDGQIGGPVLIVTGVDRDYVEPDTNPKPGFQD
jgi:hypothetical protein